MNKTKWVIIVSVGLALVTAFVVCWVVFNPHWIDGHCYTKNPNGLGHLVDGSPHYYAPNTNYAGVCGAPNGVYEQKEWGLVNSISFPTIGGWVNNATAWSFAICDHTYLGPLHGTWKVNNGTSIPIWEKGVFPIDARLIITLENNTIIKAQVKSNWAYGD